MSRARFRVIGVLSAVGLLGGAIVAAQPAAAGETKARHVLLICVDGLHESDLPWYVKTHDGSALAKLVHKGVDFTNASTPFPSDSFPGIVAQVTGGNPSSTGILYDDSWNSALLPFGTTSCAGVKPGTEVQYFEAADLNPDLLSAGDTGVNPAGLPGNVLTMTGNATSLLDSSQLPVDPVTCKPVYPHQYIKVNTVFEVARAAGLRTAWSDKHAAYEVLNGPSGKGVQDLFTPEINSKAPFGFADWTKNNDLTQQYDSYKVRSVVNEINGFDHSGTKKVGTPAIFGMNFQTVSTAQKLPRSQAIGPNGPYGPFMTGGYMADGVTPGPLLQRALDYINSNVGLFQSALKEQNLDRSTTIILSAKHGQSPMNPAQLVRIDDGAIIDALNAAWHTYAGTDKDLVAFAINDDGWLMWTTDRSEAATTWAKNFLLNHSGTGNNINGATVSYSSSGLKSIYSGAAAAAFMHMPAGDSRVPDLIGVAKLGTVFTGGKGKIAEHGGDNLPDRHVALVVSGGEIDRGDIVSKSVATTQIAPTILDLLGLNPNDLKAVNIEHTQVLPLND
ncbi:MAG: alkaline phosphatase family protein [Chloroflexi bacterium]|nr:MAG: alkaline phosphatase family protein [Chloroflexota bacterium]